MRATLPSRFALALDGGVAHAVPGGRPLRRSLHTAPAPAGPAASATLGGVAVTSSGPIGQALLEKARRLETGRFCTGVLRVRMFEAALRMCVCVIFFCLCVCVCVNPCPQGFSGMSEFKHAGDQAGYIVGQRSWQCIRGYGNGTPYPRTC